RWRASAPTRSRRTSSRSCSRSCAATCWPPRRTWTSSAPPRCATASASSSRTCSRAAERRASPTLFGRMARANESSLSALDERVGALPTSPGVYLFKSARGRVLYVGKAQTLRGRVRSYLRPGGDGRIRVPALIEGATDVEVVVTPSVKAALLLENELIKRHHPPFNVRLPDDKQHLGLRVDVREPWPRPTPVRPFREDGAAYFGPYTSSLSLRDAISNLRRIFPLRSCSDPVFRDYARRGRP